MRGEGKDREVEREGKSAARGECNFADSAMGRIGGGRDSNHSCLQSPVRAA